MAIYHLSVSNVSRASGSKATATLSYITGKRVHDERRGETYDYGRKERVLRVGTLLPEGAPAEYADPAVLFNAVELHETGRTARPAKKIVVALPREFTPRQRVQALEEYIRENLNADGYAATYAIHDDGRGNNPHAHILVANRQIDPATGGWARLKQRMEYVLDERGERVPLIDPETGRQKTDKRGRRQWKRTSVSLNPLDRKAKLKALRESWANTCNARLDETARIDHRSLEDQGSDLEPTIHEGYAARAIERAGGVSERCEANREIRRSNGLLTAIRTELGRIFDRLGELFAAKIRQLRQRQARPEPAREPNWRYFEGDARRQLEADRADRAAQAFDRMLESIGHGVDPSDAVEAMRDRDGINLMIPRNAKDSDRPVWHAWLYDRHEWAAIPSHVLREGMRTVGRVRAAIGTALHRWRDAQAARRERIARSTPAQAPRLADVARQAREDAGQPAHQPRPVRKPEQQPEQQRERPVSLAAAAKEASKQLKREQQQEPEPEPALEWNPWDPADPMNLGMGGSQGYGLGL